jgi:hypothetical protein
MEYLSIDGRWIVNGDWNKEWENMDWFHITRHMAQWQTVVDKAVNGDWKHEEFLEQPSDI